ncbi:MAG: nickel insertion protein, partial [Nitrosopumilaceae archaeon]|nr:nickel insertion protein [Nitrosopumilaceae archaeon]
MVLVIDSQVAGISGDMLLCSLVDLGADKSKIINGIKNAVEFFDGVRIEKIDFSKTKKHGTEATELLLELKDNIHERKGILVQECINKTCEKISLSKQASDFANSCIISLINAESKIHGESKDSVHFHEASSFDTVVDILGTAIALDDLGLFDDEIFS